MSDDFLTPFLGQTVVCDLGEHHLAIGQLAAVGPDHLSFTEVDLHDHREANSTKDVYLIETRKYGVRVNRKHLAVPRRQLIAICLLTDVAE
jgi:hypothetical protein